MIMKNFLKITLMSLSLIAFTACDLEEELVSDFTSPYVKAAGGGGGPTYSAGATDGSSQRVSDNIAGAFGKLRSGSAGHGSYWSMQSVSTDEMLVGVKGGDWYDGGIWVVTHRHTVSSAHGPNGNAWNAQYNGINEINNVLAGSITANEKAQLRVLRAFFYMRLMDMYGGVKIVTAAGQDPAQSTRKQVFEFAESEILAALGITAADVLSGSIDLSGSDLNTNPAKYRINQYGAMGILSRLYLNAKVWTSANTAGTDGTARWTEAANAADWVITNGPYSLVTDANFSLPNLSARPASSGLNDPETISGVLTIGAPNNQDNPEIIFSIDFDQASGKGGMPFAQMSLHQPSQNTFNLASQPWNGYQTMEDFYRKYEAGDKRLGWFLSGSQKSSAGKQLVDWAYDDKATAEAVAADGEGVHGTLDLNYSPYINELEPDSWRQSGARMFKFRHKQYQNNDMDNDFPIIRLAEMYFNRAEGRSMAAGDWSQGLADVNAVRTRAGVAPFAALSVQDFIDESGREFIFESHRRTNLVRWGKFTDAWWEKTGAKGGSVGDPNKNLFPIPLSQIQAANGSLTQNPGY
tara:strand:- start:327 stop:2060 length:1734 start_codon:yes stop_codon:yes gene_type:complete